MHGLYVFHIDLNEQPGRGDLGSQDSDHVNENVGDEIIM